MVLYTAADLVFSCTLVCLGDAALESISNHLQPLHFTPLSFVLCSCEYLVPLSAILRIHSSEFLARAFVEGLLLKV
jgi:hypothetical protein